MTQDIKELLELAAKACGYETQWDGFTNLPMMLTESGIDTQTWAPHLDDGDGARMEAQLRLMLVWQKSHVACWHRFYEGDQLMELVRDEQFSDHNGDRQAARKMASLRVAAEIGRRMMCRHAAGSTRSKE